MSGHPTEIEELDDAAVPTDTARSYLMGPMTIAEELNERVTRAMDLLISLRDSSLEPREIQFGISPESPCTIFKIPDSLRRINPKAVEPEIVSIGPYHRGQPQVRAFEQVKLLYLTRFLGRTHPKSGPQRKEPLTNMGRLSEAVASEESSARTHYSEDVNMTRIDFVQMMLLDGCFVVELLLHFFRRDDATHKKDSFTDPISARPQIIPILIGDLLKLENQIPYSLLQSLFDTSRSSMLIGPKDSLATLALELFDQAYPRSTEHLKSSRDHKCEHLLDLFYYSLSPTSGVRPNSTNKSGRPHQLGARQPSAQSVPCVTELRPSGIKFKSKKADSLLDISFRKPVLRKWVLQIPDVAIDDFMTTVLINCVSLEQCQGNRSKYMTDYVSFIQCLIKQPKDVSLLRSDGIIAPFSHDDQYVADLFDKLGKSISFNVHDCFLSKQFEELETYYRSDWAKMMRTYFSSPWSSISAFWALLLVVLSITQAVIAILNYRSHH